jgi:hypothetical protein
VARSINVKILGDASDLTRAYRQASGQTQTFGSQLGAMGKAAAFTAGAAGIGLLSVALVDSVKAAAEAEKSAKLMQTAVEQGGQSYAAYAAEIEKAVTATSKLSGLDDEALQDSFASLVRTTGDVGHALDSMSLAADVARGRNISLEAATALVTKAELGKAGALTRAGIALDGAKTSMELLAVLQEKYAGSAETYGNTTAGAHDRLRVAIENLEERVGAVLLPALTAWAQHLTTVIDKVDRVTTALAFLKPVLEAVAFVFSLQFRAALALADLYVTILTASVHAGAAALAAFRGAASAVAGFFQSVWAGAMGAARAVVAAFGAALDVVSGALTRVRAAAGTVASFLAGPYVAAFNVAKAAAAALAGGLQSVVNVLNAIISAARLVADAIRSIPSLPSIPRISIPGLPGIGIGGRAAGGPVTAGTPYMVGERGPEQFLPGRSGSIVPNHALGGNTYHINLPNYLGPVRDVAQVIRREIEAIEVLNGRAAT